MLQATLTKCIEFSSSHFYHNPAWDADKNQQIFGACCQEHGHNYLLEVMVGGCVDPVTGMIINLYDLKSIITEILEEFDHKHLNLDTPYFEHIIPTTENLAIVLWQKFYACPEIQNLDSIRLVESEDLWAELIRPNLPACSTSTSGHERRPQVSLTRRSPLSIPSATNDLGTYLLVDITVGGPIDPLTGRVTDIAVLDNLVHKHLTQRFEGKDLHQDPAFHARPLSLLTLAQTLWGLLQPVSGGQLSKITIHNQQETCVNYTAIPTS